MFIKNGLNFTTDSGTKYTYCADTCMVFEKSKIENNEISKERFENWESLYKEFNRNKIDKDTFEDINQLKQYLYRNGLNELIIEVTSSCNLRCNYCIFSGQYEGRRTHGTEKMEKETAFKAIKMYYDYYLEAKGCNPNGRPAIAFYGGDPLLNIELVKQCLKYIKSLFLKEDNVYITITTNGILLTNEIIELFEKEEVVIVLSLDGPKEIHDKNRLFPNKSGTFDIVMERAKSIEKITKNPVFVNSVYDYDTDLETVFQFFDNNPQLINIGISPVFHVSTNYYEKFDGKTMNKFQEQQEKLQKTFKENVINYKKGDKNYKPKFISQFFGRDCANVLMKQILANRIAPINFTGACVPGEKIFVDIKGNLYTCEKVDKEFIIGDVDKGLDFRKIIQMLKEYNECCKECKSCPVHNQCPLCYNSMIKNGEFFKDKIRCENIIKSFRARLSLTYSVLEKNPEWFVGFLDNYYGRLKELEVSKRC